MSKRNVMDFVERRNRLPTQHETLLAIGFDGDGLFYDYKVSRRGIVTLAFFYNDDRKLDLYYTPDTDKFSDDDIVATSLVLNMSELVRELEKITGRKFRIHNF